VRAPGRVARLRAEVERYLADVARLGLAPQVVGRGYPAGVARRYAIREGLVLLGGLPLALWGMASHALPYALTGPIARRVAASPDVEATIKLAAGVFLYPVIWALVGGPGLLVFLVALLPSGLFALGWQTRLGRVRRDARAYARFLRDRDLLARLAARRRALVAEAEALGALVPPEVLAGPGVGLATASPPPPVPAVLTAVRRVSIRGRGPPG
jgi:hypothetical protein